MMPRQPFQDHHIQFVGIDRFGQEVIHPGIQAQRLILGEGIGCHGDNRQFSVFRHGADAAGGLQAIHHRHLHVHQYQIVAPFLQALDGLTTVLGDIDRKAEHFTQQFDRHFLIHPVVFGDQNPAAREVAAQAPLGFGAADFGIHRRQRRQRPGQWQRNGETEGRADAQRAVEVNLTAHQSDQPAGNRQAQTGAAKLARRRPVGLLKGVENPRLRIGRDTDPLVTHGEIQRQRIGRSGALADRQRHLALLGKFDGIAHQIEQDLLQAQRIAQQLTLGKLRCHLVAQTHARRTDFGDQQAIEIGDQFSDREWCFLEGHFLGVDLRQIENVIEQIEQVVGGVGNLVQLVALAGVDVAATEHVGHADNGVHRGTQFVAHIGQEGALGPIGGLGSLLGQRQRLRAGSDGDLQRVALLAQGLVPLRHFAEHGVEGIGQITDLVIREFFRPLRVIARIRHPVSGIAEIGNRRQQRRLHAAGKAEGEQKGDERPADEHHQRHGKALPHPVQRSDQHDDTTRPVDVTNGHRHGDAAKILVFPVACQRGAANRQHPFRWYPPPPTVDMGKIVVEAAHLGINDVLMLAERAEQTLGTGTILEFDHRGRIEGDHIGHRVQFGQQRTTPLLHVAHGKHRESRQQANGDRPNDDQIEAMTNAMAPHHLEPPITCRARRSIAELGRRPARAVLTRFTSNCSRLSPRTSEMPPPSRAKFSPSLTVNTG